MEGGLYSTVEFTGNFNKQVEGQVQEVFASLSEMRKLCLLVELARTPNKSQSVVVLMLVDVSRGRWCFCSRDAYSATPDSKQESIIISNHDSASPSSSSNP